MIRLTAKQCKYCGFFGFFGFLGFTYFIDHNIGSLFYFSFFSFFSYFFLGELIAEMPDERYVENNNRARLKSSCIPLLTLFVIGWSASWPFGTKELIVIAASLGWAATFIVYAVLFYRYEKGEN